MSLQRAWATFEIKAVNDEERIIEGFASTPSLDRQDDIMESTGAEFTLPHPFLWQHRQDQPLGEVIAAEIRPEGIYIRAKLAQAGLVPWIDEAWTLIKNKLVRGLSVGWKPKDVEPVRGNGFAARIKKWLWLETSAVTVPANAEASILLVKSLDVQAPAAHGTVPVVRLNTPGVSGVTRQAHKGAGPMQIQEQITQFEATRQAKNARMLEIMGKSAEAGTTLDKELSDEYDTLDVEVKSIDTHLTRLASLKEANEKAAKPVNGNNPADASQSRGGTPIIQVQEQLPQGIGFARAMMCKTQSFLLMQNGEFKSALDIAKERYPSDTRLHTFLKAAVAAGTTTDATWAGPLVDPTNLASEFIEYLRPMTIIGKFGTGGIPSLRRIPFNVRINGQTSGGDAYWVGQGKPKPLTKFDFNATTLTWAKVATIAVIAQELARFSSPSAEALVRQALADAIVERIDRDFVDPDKAAVANVSPASITNGIAPLQTSGSSEADVRVDVQAIFAPFIAANLTPTNGVWIMTSTRALALSLMMNALGQPVFPNITMTGGTFLGLPVIVSQYVLTGSPASDLVILVNASDIFLADDGQVTVDVSREASLEMNDAPTQNGAAGTGASLVSLWQNNLIGLRAERFINWARRRAQAVQYLENVTWGLGGGSPT